MLDRLIAAFAREEIAWLSGRFGRALEDNREGQALLAAAVERAVWLGVEGWGIQGGKQLLNDPTIDDAWRRWRAERRLTPEAERWPERLEEVDGRDARRTLDEAERVMVDAGAELGMVGAIGGRRARRTLADVGRQAAEAGASLAYVLTAPAQAPATEAPPRAIPAAPMRDQPIPDAVKVATTSNLADRVAGGRCVRTTPVCRSLLLCVLLLIPVTVVAMSGGSPRPALKCSGG